jgi:hypothetical protein
MSMEKLLQSRRQSSGSVKKLLWSDRASLRVYGNPEGQHESLDTEDDMTHRNAYWPLAKCALGAVVKLPGFTKSSANSTTALRKLNTLSIQGMTQEGLVQLSSKEYLARNNGLRHLSLCYD